MGKLLIQREQTATEHPPAQYVWFMPISPIYFHLGDIFKILEKTSHLATKRLFKQLYEVIAVSRFVTSS